MHRILVVRLNQEAANKFEVVGDSANPATSESNPVSLQEAGATSWAEFDDSTGYSSPYAAVPWQGAISVMGYWYVNKTGNVLNFDYAKVKASERKIVTSGELHIEYDGKPYVARAGDSILFMLDLQDRIGDQLRPFPVKFFGDHECTVAFADFAL